MKKLDECPWCNVKVVVDFKDGGYTHYHCPKCGHGFESAEFKVPVEMYLQRIPHTLELGKTPVKIRVKNKLINFLSGGFRWLKSWK